MRITFSLYVVILFQLLSITAINAETLFNNTIINICNDIEEWPPYTYYQRNNGKKSSELVGFSVELVNEIFSRQNIDYTITLLPWRRCTNNVLLGKQPMLMDASLNSERAESYYISKPVYSTSSYYFYSKKHSPEGLEIASLSDLKRYRICGRVGYNYKTYGVADGEIAPKTHTFEALVLALHVNRCDLFLEKYEVISGYSTVKTNLLADKELGYKLVPGVEHDDFYFMFTKNETGRKLKQTIDEGLDILRKNGRLQQLRDKYMSLIVAPPKS
jgi:polar amino acid transport system substrate-binding protein